ncbi:unnamed protein product [Parajaminaea phylloscopi]
MPIVQARQGALSGVTGTAEDAGRSAYNAAQNTLANLSKGQIAAAIVAIVVGFALVCLMLWYLCTRKLRSRSRLNAPLDERVQMRQQSAFAKSKSQDATSAQPVPRREVSNLPSAAPTPSYAFGRSSRNAWRSSTVGGVNEYGSRSQRGGPDDEARSFLSDSTVPLAPPAKRSDSRLDALTRAMDLDHSTPRRAERSRYAQL